MSRGCREEVNHGRSLCVFCSEEAARLYIWFDMADIADLTDVTEDSKSTLDLVKSCF
jgi:hypothetical protein